MVFLFVSVKMLFQPHVFIWVKVLVK